MKKLLAFGVVVVILVVISFWPSDKPIFLPESMVPEPMKKKAKKQQ